MTMTTDTTTTTTTTTMSDTKSTPFAAWIRLVVTKLRSIYNEHEFVLLIVLAILLAKINPTMGSIYCHPQITATWIAVLLIFVLSGLGLQTSELKNAAFTNISFNLFIQCYSFFFVSTFVYVVCTYLLEPYHIITNTNLLDGMIICSCLPMAINTVIVITKSGHGDDAAALFNCAFANLIGVFVSPFLILVYIGIRGTMDPIDIFVKLSIRVVFPVFIGQLLQRSSFIQTHIVSKYKTIFKQLQQYCLVFIVYTVFCSTFLPTVDTTGTTGSTTTTTTTNTALSKLDVTIVFLCQITLLISVMIMAWLILKYLFPNQPKLHVMGFVGCTFKTVAVGVPLINAMYATTSPQLVALYTLPLLIWHPMQLIIGSMLAPYLAQYVDTELLRIQQAAQTTGIGPTETTSLLATTTTTQNV